MFYKTFLALVACFFFYPSKARDITAIMGAMPEEMAAFKTMADHRQELVVGGVHFTQGFIRNRSVVLVESGVGKVNAAMTCTLLLEHFHPSRVIFTGVAGGIGLGIHVGDIIIADSVVQHDFGTLYNHDSLSRWGAVNPIDKKRNPVFFKADSLLLQQARSGLQQLTLEPFLLGQVLQKPVIRNGIIATGDDDRLLVDGMEKKLAFTEMKKK